MGATGSTLRRPATPATVAPINDDNDTTPPTTTTRPRSPNSPITTMAETRIPIPPAAESNTNADTTANNTFMAETRGLHFGPRFLLDTAAEYNAPVVQLNSEFMSNIIKKHKSTSPDAVVYNTRALKSLVNIKRNTIRLKRLESDSSEKYGLGFTFDSSAASCVVRVYLFANTHIIPINSSSNSNSNSNSNNSSNTDNNNAKATIHFSHPQTLPLPVPQKTFTFGPFNKGCRQDFVSSTAVLPLKNDQLDTLLRSLHGPNASWPMILMIESTDTTRNASPESIPIQLTYCAMSLQKDGHFELKPLKQHAFNPISGLSYVIQEIYGFNDEKDPSPVSPATPSSPVSPSSPASSRDCVICLSAPRSVLILPCRHLCLCPTCADAFRTQFTRQQIQYQQGQARRPERSKCPYCRAYVSAVVSVVVPSLEVK